MSQIVDQRLFELVQLVNVSNSHENEPRKRSSSQKLSKLAQQLSSKPPSRQIVSFSASPCGKFVLFVAAPPHDSCESVCEPEQRPFIGAICLSKLDCITPLVENNDLEENESFTFEFQWLPWFRETSYRPSCMALSPESDFCLIGCENGNLFLFPSKVVCPSFHLKVDKESSVRDWPNKRTHKIFPIDSSTETKGIF